MNASEKVIILRAMEESCELIRGYIHDIGGCDHSVNICVCEDMRILDRLTDCVSLIKNSLERENPAAASAVVGYNAQTGNKEK